ncbi:MAG TPA: autotransporter outer membrane beta-barrel domain-containing protein [Rhizomicrobium sp.]|nr:autotransporter outer membrane beta-barrel domain-containing protein [Rhizomicrobium sp.]
MTKHRLMLSAAAAALLAAAFSPARADTEITTNTSTALSTSTSGNITISTGGVGIQTSGTPAVTINSNNSVLNEGFISNTGVDTGIGVLIDTSSGNLVSPAGLSSTGTIDLSGGGTGKEGIVISGGNTFYGPITLTSLTTTAIGGATAVTQSSSLLVKGDNSAALLLVEGTKVTSNILIGGGGIVQNASDNSTASNSIMVDLDGTVNGNVIISSQVAGTGPGMVGLQTIGGIHSCAADAAVAAGSAPSGFTCPASSGGSLVNLGSISVVGTSIYNSRGNNPEAGSAVVIGGSIDGGFLNGGPATSSGVSAATISSAGLVANGVVSPTFIIDPAKSITSTTTTGVPRTPINIGPVTADIDAADPGYSVINRGTISSQPLDPQLSTAAVIIQGYSPTYYTCLSSVAGSCDTTAHATTQTVNGSTVNVNNAGGFLNTGTISAAATTNVANVPASGRVNATAMSIGAYATVPRIDVIAETISGSTTTPGVITAQVSGVGQGNAFGLIVGQNSSVGTLNVGKGATISASVSTNTIAPTKDIATATAPFSLIAEAVIDQSAGIQTINNAGTISAVTTQLNPASGAVVNNVRRALDLQAATANNVTINNSGQILGDLLFGSTGNNHILNVGNDVNTGDANAVTGVANSPNNYAVVAESVISQALGVAPTTEVGTINFGSGTGHQLNVGGFGYVNAAIYASTGALDVHVGNNGTLFVANTSATGSMNANNLQVDAGGTLGLTISQNTTASLPVVKAATQATLAPNSNIALQFGTFVSSGFTAQSVNNPTPQDIILINAPVINIDAATLAADNAALALRTPFLFQQTQTPLSLVDDSSGQNLVLTLTPRSPGATNADGTPGLGLSGDALKQFPFIATALGNDTELGSAIASSMTVYNTAGQPTSGINIPASQQQAQQAFSQFAPDVSGGTREIAIMITDQASGPVAARQRLLRSFSDEPGEMTLWGEEFAGHINNKGRVSGDGSLTSYKDHGFGFSLGVDGGSARNGWYGGAFTFYSGDVAQLLPRATKTQTEWYMLTGYTEWKGKHVFLDTQLSAAYGNFSETRSISEGGVSRVASSKRPAAMLALGANTGMMLHYSGIEVDPHISLDGLTMREEGYSETGGGSGFDLQVAPYFANSLRTAVGADVKGTVSLWGIDLTPEGRLGYRYDVLQQAVKIKAAFESTGGLGTAGNTMTFIGPDPDSGNAILGLSLGAKTDTWQLGINYDWIRGDNGSTTQVGTLTVLGRI